MTKEQYLVFKSDLKATVEIARLLSKKFNKEYYNAGYKTLEEFNAAYNEASKKSVEIERTIKVKEKGYGGSLFPVIKAHEQATHLAYYCAKHQLSEAEMDEYLQNEIRKMRYDYEVSEAEYNRMVFYMKKRVMVILDAYEKVVCSD